MARKVLLPPRAARSRIPERRGAAAPGPRPSLAHKGQRWRGAAGREVSRAASHHPHPRWRRPLPGSGPRWRSPSAAAEPSRANRGARSRERGEGEGGGGAGGRSRACELYGVEKFPLQSPPPCVRSFASRARLLESRLRSYPSALLTAPAPPRRRRGRRPRDGWRPPPPSAAHAPRRVRQADQCPERV